jgi:recombination protein RecT
MVKDLAKFDFNKPAPDGIVGLQRMSEVIVPQLAKALPKFLADAAPRMLRCLFTECQRTPALLDCSPRSLFGGCIQVAQLGLELGGPMGQAYLIPFKGQASCIIGYKGYIALAHRSRLVRRITPRVVRAGDEFSIVYGSHQRIIHIPNRDNAGEPTDYYTSIVLTNGGDDFEAMTKREAEIHRDRYALSKKGAWATHFDEQAMKTCIRRLAKRMPVSVEVSRAAGLDEQAEADVEQHLGVLVSVPGDDEQPDLRERLDKAKGKAKPERVVGVDEPDAEERTLIAAGATTMPD